MDVWKKIVGQNWPFYSHQKLYDMVRTEATGASAVSDAEQTWREFAELMAQSRANIERLLTEAGASWEGLASESMRSGMTPLAQWIDDARTAGTASNGSVAQVGESFSYTANAMPEPVKVTSTANSDVWGIPATFTHLFGGQTDQDRQVREAQEAKQRAVDLMRGYSRNAGSAASGIGTFVPPQRVTVNVPPPQLSGDSVNYTSGSIAGPSVGERRQAGPRDAPFPDSRPGSGDPAVVAGSPNSGGVAAPPTDQPEQNTTPGSAAPIGSSPLLPEGGPSLGSAPVRGFDPMTGLPVDPKAGRPVGGGPWSGGSRGPGGGADGEHPRGGRGGALTGSMPVDCERVAGARSGAGTRGVAGAGAVGPIGAGAGTRREEDKEHHSPDYLHDYHDEFWADIPPVAQPVIGADDPPPPEGTENEGGGGGSN